MIPYREPIGSRALPSQAKFWTPRPADISDEGFGFFRDVWPILQTPVDEAREYLAAERKVLESVNSIAMTEERFDLVASAIEDDDVDRSELTSAERRHLQDLIDDAEQFLDGLELGVGGLVYALSAVGAFPAASCRGHIGPAAWSESPVVLVAIDEFRASVLEPMVTLATCRFDIDPARADLLVIRGSSVMSTVQLAEAILATRSAFTPGKTETAPRTDHLLRHQGRPF
ncbi:hypothetical protein [Kribbella sp. NPDC055071]